MLEAGPLEQGSIVQRRSLKLETAYGKGANKRLKQTEKELKTGNSVWKKNLNDSLNNRA